MRMSKAPTVFSCLILLIIVMLSSSLFMWAIMVTTNSAVTENIPRHNFPINTSYIISLDHESSKNLIPLLQKYLFVENVSLFAGVNQTEAMNLFNSLPLYTKYVMKTGRSDHMQLSNPSMLGCLLSHITIWENVRPKETVLVLEEDAHLDLQSATVMEHLSSDMKSIHWDVLMLESGHFLTSGKWISVGGYAATCAPTNITNNICTWFGTRGYMITYEGAQKLLAHTFPVHVQIDAYMGLLAAFNPEFKMYWTRENVVHQQLFHISKVWDGCLKCYMPQTSLFYVIVLLVFVYNVLAAISYKMLFLYKKYVHDSLFTNSNCI